METLGDPLFFNINSGIPPLPYYYYSIGYILYTRYDLKVSALSSLKVLPLLTIELKQTKKRKNTFCCMETPLFLILISGNTAGAILLF